MCTVVFGTDVVRDAERVRARIGLVFGGERGLYGTFSGRDTLRSWDTLYMSARAAHSAQRSHSHADDTRDVIGLVEVARRPLDPYANPL